MFTIRTVTTTDNGILARSARWPSTAETDRLWSALLADGGKEIMCGWLSDRFGMSWQIVPEILPRMFNDSDTAAASRARTAMMPMKKIDIAALQAAFHYGSPAYTAYCTSSYVRVQGGWRLVQHQQTPT